MTVAKSKWCRRDRRRFLACLAVTGDPVLATQEVNQSLESAFALRAADEGFAAGWSRAVDIAWELVETKVLARLLASEEELPASARLLDSKLALAILQRRALTQGAAEERGAVEDRGPVTDEAVARLRAEIRALAEARPAG